MLEFNLPSPTPPQPKKKEEKKESPKGTPDVGEKRRDSKSKKKSKKSRHGKEEPETMKTKSTGQQGGGGGGDGVTTTSQVPVASDDPFGPIAALDAWLNADTTEPAVCYITWQCSKVHVVYPCCFSDIFNFCIKL
jgi:outer membrane biosynthesis protein TonB